MKGLGYKSNHESNARNLDVLAYLLCVCLLPLRLYRHCHSTRIQKTVLCRLEIFQPPATPEYTQTFRIEISGARTHARTQVQTQARSHEMHGRDIIL